MKYYLYNCLSNNGIKPNFNGELIDATKIDYKKFVGELKEDDEIVLVGGDGTICYFINEVDIDNLKNNVYLYPNGTGNDFVNDINEQLDKEILLNPYFVNLPTVYVNGMHKKFINNMGLGIDGYCCEEADRIKAKTPNKKINYTAIAIKGLLFKFKPRHIKVTVDGKTYEFDNAWLAPTMKGRYYGGGMMIAPGQNRKSDTLTVVVYASKSKLKSLINFPLIFEGKHVEKKDLVTILTGKKVHVEFSSPCAAQIDGDTVLNVKEYTVEI